LRLHLVQEVSRTIDYLETRSDIDHGRLTFAGYSWGAYMGLLASAIDEKRIKVNVLAAGGFGTGRPQPEADPFQFASRVKVPTLMLNGRDDFTFPLETSQKPFFQALGTAPEHKRHALFDWLDRYLGPVK
jgi:dienelactone hydrolase